MSSPDPSALGEVEVRRIQPYEATKRYVCPGCNQDIPPGTGHLVAVPQDAPDLRRHWHRGCWTHRHRRRPGRRG
ncbi:MAG TPA: hypothetical protein VK866_18210 [Acidimicrobiales bacterium]|nr:hypothetical protein [Acidimicrobiales bacterium]